MTLYDSFWKRRAKTEKLKNSEEHFLRKYRTLTHTLISLSPIRHVIEFLEKEDDEQKIFVVDDDDFAVSEDEGIVADLSSGMIGRI